MSSYNNIEKIRYSKSPDDVVALQEYILFEDSRAQEKFIVFKFMNNLNQRLHEIRFEVLQYNEQAELLEKSVVVHNNFIAGSNSPFVPNAKLQVNYGCKSICVNLIFAAFDRTKWENGQFSDNTFKFDRYANAAVPAPTVQPVAVNAKSSKSKSKKKKKNVVFGVKNISDKNIAVAPRIINVILCLIVIAAVVASLLWFKDTSNKVCVDGFSLEIVAESTYIDENKEEQKIYDVNIIDYDGLETDITVPTKIGKYTVNKIREGAFDNSNITSITFDTQNELTVEGEAFKNCNALTDVTSTSECGKLIFMSEAFYECDKLINVNLPTANLSENSLYGCNTVKNLTFNGLIANDTFPLKNLFGEPQEKLEITTLTVNLGHITSDFLENSLIHTFNFNEDCKIDYGALENVAYLANSYVKTDYCEILSGEIMSVNVIDGAFTLPKGVNVFNTQKFTSEISRITSLKIETATSDGLELDESFLSKFTAVNSLEITNSEIEIPKPLNYLPALNEFISPVMNEPLAFYVQGTGVTSIGITGGGRVTADYLQGLSRIRQINIAEAVTGVDENAFAQTSLTSLCIPLYSLKPLSQNYTSGLSNLTYVKVIPSNATRVIPDECFTGLTRLTVIEVADGFTGCGKNIVSAQTSLREIKFNGNINFASLPVIGENCFYLNTVKVGFASYVPESYSSFNASAKYTQKLTISYSDGGLPANFLDEACENITNLTLDVKSVESSDQALLKNCKNLTYLELQTQYIDTGFAEMFGVTDDSTPVKIHTVVINCANLTADGIKKLFEGNVVCNEVIINGEQYAF